MPANSTIYLWLEVSLLFALLSGFIHNANTKLQSQAEILLLHDSPIPFHISFQACNDRISRGLITRNSTCISGHNFLIFSGFKMFVLIKYLSYRPILATDKTFFFPHRCASWGSQNPDLLCKLQSSHSKLQCFPEMSPLKAQNQNIQKSSFPCLLYLSLKENCSSDRIHLLTGR